MPRPGRSKYTEEQLNKMRAVYVVGKALERRKQKEEEERKKKGDGQ